MAWTGRVMAKLGLVLNETKTAIRDSRRERFDFLGYSHAQKFRVWISEQVRRATAPDRREMRRRARSSQSLGT
jgi:hypothetical protein